MDITIKSPWDATDRYMICHKVKQTYKSVAPKEPGIVGVIDTRDKNKFIKIGVTHSWNVQQGCMAQWMGPDYSSRILYNDFRNGNYCAVIYNFVMQKEEKVLPMAAYDVAKDGSFILSLDFSRLHRLRPGYGYSNLPDETKDELCPNKGCIWKVNVATGEIIELFKYTDFATFEPEQSMMGAEHKVNHLMISPNCKRFMVLHRWFKKGRKHTRLITVNVDKSDMYNLSDDVFVSHCYWKNDKEILSFLRKKETGDHYYLLRDKTQKYRMFWPELNTDGHCSYSTDGRYIITDTYPNRKRIASVFLCTEEDNRSRQIARVFAPFKYDNDCRCDLHPRWNHTEDKVCIDSTHEGKRGLFIIEINNLGDIIFSKNKIDKDKPLLSFIVPTYNSAQTLKRCIDSIISQTNSNWELIIVDDGSTDNTNEIVKEFLGEYNIRYIYQENGGPGKARNNGIKHAKGYYIVFLDSDDYFEPDLVEKLSDLYVYTNPDVVFYESIYEKKDGSIIKQSHIYKYQSDSKLNFITRQMSGSFSWGATKIIRKDIIEANNASFTDCDVGEESLFTFKVLNGAKRIEFIKCPEYHYVQTSEGQHKKGKEDPLKKAVYSFSNVY